MHSCYNLILKNVIYMFWAMKVHHQEVGCGIEVLWYVLSKNFWYYGESSV